MRRNFKKVIAIAMTAIMMLGMSTSVFAEEEEATLYAEIADGQNGENFLNEDVPEMEQFGPKSFAITSDGDIYILDTLNSKVKLYGMDGVLIDSLALPSGAGEFIDMAITDSLIYVLSEYGNTFSFNLLSKSDGWSENLKQAKTNTIGLFENNGDIIARQWDYSDDNLTSRARNISTVSKSVIGSNVELKTNGTTINVKYSATPIGTYVAKSDATATYVVEQEALLGFNPYAEIRVGKYVDGVKEATALAIAANGYDSSMPFRKIYLTPSGDVYQLIPTNSGVNIYSIPWTPGEKTGITAEMLALDAIEPPQAAEDEAAPRANVSKAVALDRANDMCFHGWWYNGTTHRTPSVSNYTESPEQLGSTAFQSGGIPYCWGGMNGVDTSSFVTNVSALTQNFETALSKGQTAGNIETTSVSTTAGLDCSGMVAAAYKIPKKISTYDIPDYFTKTSWPATVPGDIANYSSRHVFMIQYKYTSMGENYLISTYESTTDGDVDAAKGYDRYYFDVVDNYLPMVIK